MAEIRDDDIGAAMARGEEMLKTKPRARSVRYDLSTDRVVIEFTDDCVFMFPPRLVRGLQDVAVEELSAVTVLGAGFVLSWDGPDVQISVEGLMDGIFGTGKFMQAEMARKAGSATSPAKAAAARSNGAKGGRPRKVA